jgi:hypothetical protein
MADSQQQPAESVRGRCRLYGGAVPLVFGLRQPGLDALGAEPASFVRNTWRPLAQPAPPARLDGRALVAPALVGGVLDAELPVLPGLTAIEGSVHSDAAGNDGEGERCGDDPFLHAQRLRRPGWRDLHLHTISADLAPPCPDADDSCRTACTR